MGMVEMEECDEGVRTVEGGGGGGGGEGGCQPQGGSEAETLPFPGFQPVAIRYLRQEHKLRFTCLRMITNPWFERLSIIVILINCVTLGMYRPCEDDINCTSYRCKVLQVIDDCVFAFFAIEMMIKNIAMGVTGIGSYMSDKWNWLDCFIVFSGLFEYCIPNVESVNLSAIRTIRVLRPLRAINRIPSMRILVMLLLDTLPMLGNVLLLCFFVFFIFGIIGVQLWAGTLRQRCYIVPEDFGNITISTPLSAYFRTQETEKDYICSLEKDNGMHYCKDLPPSRYQGYDCDMEAQTNSPNLPVINETGVYCVNWNRYYRHCRSGEKNPFQGAISFDNIGLAWVAIFLVISLEGWTDIMYYVQDAHSFWDWIYFVLLIVIGSFFMINLCLVVIATQFSETKKRELERMRIERARFTSTSTLTRDLEHASCYSEIVKLIGHWIRKTRRKARRRWQRHRKRHDPEGNQIDLNVRGSRHEELLKLERETSGRSSGYTGGLTCPQLLALSGALNALPQVALGTSNVHGLPDWAELSHSLRRGAPLSLSAPLLTLTPPEDATVSEALERKKKPSVAPSDPISDVEEEDEWAVKARGDVKNLGPFRLAVRKMVETTFFQKAILFAILINTLSMGVEYHNQPEELTSIVELSNLVFSGVFFIEMIIKLTAYGLVGYLSNGFDVFDGVIVILSGVEILQGLISGQSSSGGALSVLRTFRLLRILKLVRFLPNLRRQLVVMLKTMDNVAVFFSLLILFIFIFSILGMNLFGCKFCEVVDDISIDERTNHIRNAKNETMICERKNFDTLLWSLVTVFQVSPKSPHFPKWWKFTDSLGRHWIMPSLLGIILFGGKFCTEMCCDPHDPKIECICSRSNFNTLLWSTITVFQILTQEDWNIVLFNGMDKTSPWAALYFVALMTFGNYVLFNLLVAILVEGFSAERIEREQREREEAERRAIKEAREAKRLLEEGDSSIIRDDMLMENPPGCSTSLVPASIVITHTAATPEGSPHVLLAESRSNLNSPRVSYTSLNSSNYIQPIDNISEEKGFDLNLKLITPPPHRRKNGKRGSFPTTAVSISMASGRAQGKSPSSLSPYEFSPQSLSQTSTPLRSPCLKRAKSWREEREQRKKERRCSLSPNLKMNEHSQLNNNNIHNSWCDSISECTSSRLSLGGSSPPISITPSGNSGGGIKPSLAIRDTQFNPKEKCLNMIQWGRDKLDDIQAWLDSKYDYAFFIFPPESPFRIKCHKCIEYPSFDQFILFLIALNCITLAVERPSIPPDSTERYILQIFNDLFTVLFFLEMSLKVISQGGFRQYFHSGWNVMDGCLVMVSVVDQIISVFMDSPKIFGILRVFRLLRSLRPLRVINRAPGLKLVVQTLLSSLRPIGNIVLICCTFFIIFGILGVQLFKGTFYFCNGPNLTKVRNKTDCQMYEGNVWINRKYNFDDLGQALMALFVLSSKDGWVGIMYSGLDSVGVDQQPIENYNEWRLLYFISFLLLVGFFVLNMFVGVVVENFHRCREEQEKEERAARAIKRSRKLEKRRRKMREPPYWSNYSRWRLRINGLVTSKYFDLAIAGIIGLNVVTMACEFYMMPKELEYVLKIFNYFFTEVFILESALKLVALGGKRYMANKWNQLDILIVILSVVGIVLEKMESDFIPINPTIMRVMRVLRIARVLKLLKMAGGIRALLDTVVQALPQVGNLGLLFFLLFFIFSALGVELFGRLLCDEEHPCEGLGEHANFNNFGMAFLTLFRVATGDNWNGIMKDTLRDNCDPSVDCFKNCCVSHVVAPLFFVVFVLMAQFVLVNVVVAVLMKHLEESNKAQEDDLDIELELEAELAAQEEFMAKLEDSNTHTRALIRRIPKVCSLPDNFIYTYFKESSSSLPTTNF